MHLILHLGKGFSNLLLLSDRDYHQRRVPSSVAHVARTGNYFTQYTRTQVYYRLQGVSGVA